MTVNATDPSVVTNAQPAAAAPPTAAATPAIAPPPPAASHANPAQQTDPNWLNDRIAQAKKSAADDVLKSLGVTDLEAAKSAIAAANAKAEADKTAEQRATELAAKLESEKAAAAKQAAVIAEHAGRMMVGLTAEQKAAVTAIAGDDPAAQLRAISALQPTWASAAAPAAANPQAGAAAASAAAQPPVNTAPGHTAPAGSSPGSTPNARAEYEALRSTNPFAAAEHGLRHAGEVYKTRG